MDWRKSEDTQTHRVVHQRRQHGRGRKQNSKWPSPAGRLAITLRERVQLNYIKKMLPYLSFFFLTLFSSKKSRTGYNYPSIEVLTRSKKNAMVLDVNICTLSMKVSSNRRRGGRRIWNQHKTKPKPADEKPRHILSIRMVVVPSCVQYIQQWHTRWKWKNNLQHK